MRMSNETPTVSSPSAILILDDDETFSSVEGHIVLLKSPNAEEYLHDIRVGDIIYGDMEQINADLDEEDPILSNDDFEVLSVKHLLEFYLKNR